MSQFKKGDRVFNTNTFGAHPQQWGTVTEALPVDFPTHVRVRWDSDGDWSFVHERWLVKEKAVKPKRVSFKSFISAHT